MSSFEQDFPSLKDEIIDSCTKDLMIGNCLDKQRVREVLIKATNLDINDDRILYSEPYEFLLKELGL